MTGNEIRRLVGDWTAHTFRQAANEAGWLIKKVGVENLFSDRIGARDMICRHDSACGWLLRAWPDMAMHARLHDGIFEANVESKSMETPYDNASVEFVQVCILLPAAQLGVPIYYLFGRPRPSQGHLEAWIISLEKLRPWRIDLTQRSQGFGLKLEDKAKLYYPGVDILLPKEVEKHTLAGRAGGPPGSRTPYMLIPKTQIMDKGQPYDDWLKANSDGTFTPEQRIAWYGRGKGEEVEARQNWGHRMTFKEWQEKNHIKGGW